MSQKSGDEEKPEVDVKEEAKEEASPIPIPRKKTYLEELVVFEGIRTTRVSFLTLILRPFIACLTPVCLWAGLVYGVAITWLVLIATAVAQIFSAPRKFTTRFMSTEILLFSQLITLVRRILALPTVGQICLSNGSNVIHISLFSVSICVLLHCCARLRATD